MKKILLNLLALLFVLSACDNSNLGGIDTGEPTPTPTEGPVAEMSFRSALSADQLLGIDDATVIELDLVICKNGEYKYTRPGYFSRLYGTFRSTLQVEEGIDIYYFANCRSVLESADMIGGESWEDIRERVVLTDTETEINGSKVLPMWGFMKNVSIKDNVINNLGTVKLLRSVASVNVIFDPNRTGMDFEPTVAYLYYAANKAYAAPADNNLDIRNGELKGLLEPLSPEGMSTSLVKRSDINPTTGASETFYTFDNSTDSYLDEGGSNPNRRTRLVVGGYLNGSSTLTYYPLDFFRSEDGQQAELLKVTRNSQYSLTITSVNGEGWTDPDIAAEKAPVNISYNVINWTENTHENIGVYGPDYLSISSKSATLHHKAGSKATIRVSGTFELDDFNLSFRNTDNGVEVKTGKTITNDRFKVELQGTGTNLLITVTALGNYSSEPAENEDAFALEAGRIKFDIDITQISSGGWYDGGSEDVYF